MDVIRKSELTGKTHIMRIPALHPEKLSEWESMDRQSRPYIQDFFWMLTADEREFLLSGATPEEWDRLIPELD